MRFGVVSLFPEMVREATGYGVIGRAVDEGNVELRVNNPRDFTTDKHRSVDDRPFGGGPGMVMKPGPLGLAIDDLKSWLPQAPVICLTPQGRRFDQAAAVRLHRQGSAIVVAGRYEGIDERVISRHVDEELSLGDFILSGGEIAALAVIDSITRLVPGVLGDPLSAEQDSFGADGLLDCPHYTRPEVYQGETVPQVLMSGNHSAIKRWRHQQALIRTRDRRPDLLMNANLSMEDKQFLNDEKTAD